eukprot:c6855_g1_i2.p1 GENE.c6855_g1_i2~~c6855_g1_i2.p1  ORF type:complete len:680 (+),score=211.38 c6855_g1_i2:126-2042(+)
MRDKATIKRLSMYGAKPKRDRNGKIVSGGLSKVPEAGAGRTQPNRKWFGNTRVIGQKELERFREEVSTAVKDPYVVLLKQKKLPMGLLTDAKTKQTKMDLLGTESFQTTFGKKSTRKRPRLSTSTDLQSLVETAETKSGQYQQEKDTNIKVAPEWVPQRDSVFGKGTSKRIWAELYKVIDSSDVVIQVLDARDPMGTRCRQVEKYLTQHANHKHLILVLNKCDLVPSWVATRWIKVLSHEYPTLAFHASMQNPFGKGSLIQLLRQFAILHKDKKQISVGLIGYPNVGKSSVVNALKQKRVCKVAPIPGETKVWQYITLTGRIYLIDCPGIVYPQGDTDADIVLKSVVRVEMLEEAAQYIEPILKRVKKEFLVKTYKVKEWCDAYDFLAQVAVAAGKLLKKGEPDVNTVAKMILHDWQRGNLPWFVMPPAYEDDAPTKKDGEEKKEGEEGNDGEEGKKETVGDGEDDEEEQEEEEDGNDANSDDDGLSDLKVNTRRLVMPTAPEIQPQTFNDDDFFIPSDIEGDSDNEKDIAGAEKDIAGEDDDDDEEEIDWDDLAHTGAEESGAAGEEVTPVKKRSRVATATPASSSSAASSSSKKKSQKPKATGAPSAGRIKKQQETPKRTQKGGKGGKTGGKRSKK